MEKYLAGVKTSQLSYTMHYKTRPFWQTMMMLFWRFFWHNCVIAIWNFETLIQLKYGWSYLYACFYCYKTEIDFCHFMKCSCQLVVCLEKNQDFIISYFRSSLKCENETAETKKKRKWLFCSKTYHKAISESRL